MTKINKITSKILLLLRITFLFLGISFFVLLILATSSVPFWARYRLSVSKADVPENARSILLMGGGGFPSESALIRLWYTASLAHQFPEAKIIVTTPGKFSDSTSTVFQMYNYLLNNGIAAERIVLETEGLNTRHQALESFQLFRDGRFEEPLVIVTSPSHVYRSVKSFQKAGFVQVSGKPTIEAVLETDLRVKGKKLGGNEFVPGVSNSTSLRYTFWDYLKYETDIIREYIAISYYKVKGWI